MLSSIYKLLINIMLNIIIATSVVSLSSLTVIMVLYFKKEVVKKITLFLVALSAGSLMGGAFLHLLPEASHLIETEQLFLIVLISFIVFFLLEKIMHWRHCHDVECEIHTFGKMNLLGDSVHNFIDGIIIAGSFMVDFKIGVVSTILIALHEIPQELGDFGVLLHAGYKRKTALLLNFLISLTVIVGGIFGYFLVMHTDNLLAYLLPFAAGGFIYIAASDLIPEIKKQKERLESVLIFIMFLLGVSIPYLVGLFEISH
jgi:zinc and cadmium transporter